MTGARALHGSLAYKKRLPLLLEIINKLDNIDERVQAIELANTVAKNDRVSVGKETDEEEHKEEQEIDWKIKCATQ